MYRESPDASTLLWRSYFIVAVFVVWAFSIGIIVWLVSPFDGYC